MSTTLFDHAFGIRGYKHISTESRGGAIYFTVRHHRCDWRGSKCGNHRVTPRGRVLRLTGIPKSAGSIRDWICCHRCMRPWWRKRL